MDKLHRILGKRGRITIPYAIRQSMGFGYNDVLSFTEGDDGRSVIIRREKPCGNCNHQSAEVAKRSLQVVLTALSFEEQMAAFMFLIRQISEKQAR